MKIGILADDLTGANDSGVQLAKYGLKTSVFIDPTEKPSPELEAIVFDTDSRSIPSSEAYQKVRRAAEVIQNDELDIVYKKMDSTLRGNLGAEIDAIDDVFQPDFVVISPAYPQNDRTICDGIHYLHGTPLDQTEFAQNLKDPVIEAHVPTLIGRQTERSVGFVSKDDLDQGESHVFRRLQAMKKNNIPYVVFDGSTDDDLQKTVQYVYASGYQVVWAGSAGLANDLPKIYGMQSNLQSTAIKKNERSTLFVIGSMSEVTRKQMDVVLQRPDVKGVELRSDIVASGGSAKEKEIERIVDECDQLLGQKYHLVVYSAASKKDIKRTQAIAEDFGLTSYEVSMRIVEALGEISVSIMGDGNLNGLVMSGGDTAKQVCALKGYTGFELMDELEPGIPIGRFLGSSDLYAITKAGAFGNEQTFVHAIRTLKGEDVK